jgi:carbon monoxide dehydrogenase subunit G
MLGTAIQSLGANGSTQKPEAMIIESPVITCGKTPEFLHAHISEPGNLEALLPKEHVQSFAAEGDGCTFKVTGGFDIVLKRTEGEAPRVVRYASQKGTPIRFNLEIIIEASGDAESTVQIQCDADLNPFMKMMAEKPLQNIFQGMAAAAEEAFPVEG